jgi:hypothetical protein
MVGRIPHARERERIKKKKQQLLSNKALCESARASQAGQSGREKKKINFFFLFFFLSTIGRTDKRQKTKDKRQKTKF